MFYDIDDAIKFVEYISRINRREHLLAPNSLAWEERFYDAEKRYIEYEQIANWLKELKDLKER